MFANAELRFPLIEAALTPVGVIGGIRGVFFANIGGGWFDNQPSSAASTCAAIDATSSSPAATHRLHAGHRHRDRRVGFPIPDPATQRSV